MKTYFGIFIAIIIGIIGYNFAWYSTGTDLEITVTGKERIVESNGNKGTSSKYLVFTENETFENTDAIFLGKWNSSDIQGALRIDSTYQARVYGWRIPFLSTYRNIVKIK